MSNKVSIGGNRLGSGNKMDIALRNFERSNHDMGYVWRSTMACGTLVPYMVEVGLPGDTFDIKLNADVKTYPTVGPLFGTFKLQLDVFKCPIRLYQGLLHNNPLGVGMSMNKVLFPQVELATMDSEKKDWEDIDTSQINPSSIMSYLGIKGIGVTGINKGNEQTIKKNRNALSWLAYWDIYKNYYANKQEEIGAYINTGEVKAPKIISLLIIPSKTTEGITGKLPSSMAPVREIEITSNNVLPDELICEISTLGVKSKVLLKDLCISLALQPGARVDTIRGKFKDDERNRTSMLLSVEDQRTAELSRPQIETFPLKNIDDMRDALLKETTGKPFVIKQNEKAPYGTTIKQNDKGKTVLRNSQQGLALKTYQSDIFNNWVSTEWIEGTNGIAEVTAVDVKDGKLKIDALIMAKKVHNMLSRVAISGGSYYDWIQAVYSENTSGMSETPMYMGGLSKEIIFQEVISNAETSVDGVNPLGTLAGKGGLSGKHKGGKVYVRVDEPSYIIGIISITPRIDYSQGNRWDTRLKTMDDLHKPSLDGIGFQDLITDKMAWWDTHGENDAKEVLKSAGKQPAWLDYMTNYNRTYGHFANKDSEMFMTLNRRYEADENGNIKDLTTYIDPSKFNYAFAMTDLTSQNFWVQVGVDISARRKISAKQIPNL